MSRCSLVHPRTSKLGPADQAKGNYEYTPPVVRAYLLGEVLSDEDLQDVTEFYAGQGLPLPTFPAGPALAGHQHNTFPKVRGEWNGGTLEPKPAGRVIRKSTAVMSDTAVLDACSVLVNALSDEHKETLLNILVDKLGYSVE